MALDEGLRALQGLPDMSTVGKSVEECEKIKREIRDRVKALDCKVHPEQKCVALCPTGPLCRLCLDERKASGDK